MEKTINWASTSPASVSCVYQYATEESCLIMDPTLISALMSRDAAVTFELYGASGELLDSNTHVGLKEIYLGYSNETKRDLGTTPVHFLSDKLDIEPGEQLRLVITQSVTYKTVPGLIGEGATELIKLMLVNIGSSLAGAAAHPAVFIAKGSGGLITWIEGRVTELRVVP